MIDMHSIRAIGQKRRVATCGRQPDDPTPEEIKAACLEIQAGWNEVTRRGRTQPVRPVDLGVVARVVEEDE